jgi:hypothetical protein
LWKVTRSITPEISSVAGLRSGIAAFIGDSFSRELSASLITEIVLVGEGGGFLFEADGDRHHFHHSDHTA